MRRKNPQLLNNFAFHCGHIKICTFVRSRLCNMKNAKSFLVDDSQELDDLLFVYC